EVPSFKNVGFPIAEMHEDGSFVITKHPGTGGLVSKGTVTAQLLYEVRGPSYLTPDVVVRFDTIHIQEEDADRVMINGVKGEPPTESSKVCINDFSGYRNSMTVVLTGLDIEEKAKIVEDTLFETLEGKEQFAVADVQLIRSEKIDPDVNEEAVAGLRISVMDPDKNKVGRLFSSKVVELALANIPGFTLTSPPTNGMPAIRHWPALVSSHFIKQTVSVAGKEFIVEAVKPDSDFTKTISPEYKTVQIPDGKMINAPLGHAFATRSGDKGGNANLGVWAKTYEGFSYLKDFLTVNRLKELLPDMSEYEIERYELPNLLALNFYIKGVLGEGAAASIRSDPQAKTLGEYLRAKIVEMPEEILVYKD
ncbi:MAG: acyclic terpene utilization AtuA family protein, partial [Deltaproteobacteria bacterium]|nr:acyclic terpene utilization AtuA family protein [Deltaproteobacteria bacterium]